MRGSCALVRRLRCGWLFRSLKALHSRYSSTVPLPVTITAVTIVLLLLSMWTRHFEHLMEQPDGFKWPNHIRQFVDVKMLVDWHINSENLRFLHIRQVDNYGVMKSPRCPADRKTPPLLILVKSHIHNEAQRDVIRRTWGEVARRQGAWVVFVVGNNNREDHMLDMLLETSLHDDLLLEGARDTWANLTVKLMTSLDYAARGMFCGTVSKVRQPDFTLMIDDDYMLSVPNLFQLLKTRDPNSTVYEGWVLHDSPARSIFSSHRIPLDAFPFAHFPPHVVPGAILFSARTILEFHLASRHTAMIGRDDIYPAFLAASLNRTATHNENFRYHKSWFEPDWMVTIAAHGYSPSQLLHTFKAYNELLNSTSLTLSYSSPSS